MTEKRKFLRFETAINALCEVISEKCKVISKIKNISKEGALVVMDRPLRQGDEISLSMDVPGDNVPIFATCHVAWQKKAGAAAKNDDHYETGVKFVKMANHDRGRLLEHIYTQWLRFLDKI